ncbi:MAG: hypothetical protein AAF423_00485 [Pseudomonadota bacterium]
MSHTFTRQELFNLVWSEPMKTLAGRFNLSDSGLANDCKRANIPRPPRGYWAKLAVGKAVSRSELPQRGPGMSDEVEIGKEKYGFRPSYSEEELLNSEPQPPFFEDTIEDMAVRVQAMVPKVVMPPFPSRAHRQIQRLLDADTERQQKKLSSKYTFLYENPLFEDAFEKRRFRILNAIMTALEKVGMTPSIQGREARNLSVMVNDTRVHFSLDAPTQKYDSFQDASVHSRGTSEALKFQIRSMAWPAGFEKSWEDNGNNKLEGIMTDIVVELIICGERQYRDSKQCHYEWIVESKAKLIEEIRLRKEEAARKETERIAALEKARIDRLLGDTIAFRQAKDIRAYVADIECLITTGEVPVKKHLFDNWREWALAQANRIDPVHSGTFLDSMTDRKLDELHESDDT